MSGGVDSAVAAARAVDAGHDVTGVHLALSAQPATLRQGARGCCTIEDSHDARRAADVLGIPFYVWDLAERFRADVIDDFVSEYAAGRTPNPCLRCNEKIKFTAVLDRALALGFDAVVDRSPRAAGGRSAAALGRRREGPVLRAGGVHAEAAGARGVPARRLDQGAGAGRGGAARARGGRQAGLLRHLLHRRRRHPRFPFPKARGARGADRRRAHRRRRRHPPGHPRLHGRPAARPRPAAGRRPTATRATCCRCARPTTPSWSGRRRRCAPTSCARRGRCGRPERRRRASFACSVQLRAHGMASPATVRVDARRGLRDARRRADRRRRRAGAGDVRRRHGAGFGHDQCRVPAAQ